MSEKEDFIIYPTAIPDADIHIGPENRTWHFSPIMTRSPVRCGLTTGEYAFAGAGAVVTRAVAACALVYGNRARHQEWRREMGYKLVFDERGQAVCPESRQLYRLKNNQVQKINIK
jgi:UDP-2-acetamido-3-amino-2,3-dideoxy-glucuronate N-acetyltransferase